MFITIMILSIYLVANDNIDNITSANLDRISNTENNQSFNFDNDFFFDDDDDPFINEFLDTVGSDLPTRKVDPSDIINLLCEIGAKEILRTDFFLHTNPLNQRSLLDEPLFEPDRCHFASSWIVGAHIFARKKDCSNFTFRSTCINSYLALNEPTLLDRIQNTINLIRNLLNEPQFNIDINKIFSLFARTTVEERRSGFMFHIMRQWQDITLRVLFPIYYLESNFSLSNAEQNVITEEFGALNQQEQDNFKKKHFISDELGIGDTRVELDFDLIEKEGFLIRLGTQATVPTAFTWGAGFKGTSFPKPSTFPVFDFDTLFRLAENPTKESPEVVFRLLSKFFLGALDRISANLLDTKLGNGGHFGLGIFLRSKVPLNPFIKKSWAQNLAYANRLSIEYLFPVTQKRFFINKINQKQFERNFSDTSKAQENLTFLEEKFIQRIYLRAFDTRIQPGIIFRWTSKLCHQGKRWGFNIGTDFWIQDKEKFRSINASQKTLAQIDIAKAIPPVAYQGKIFGSIVLKVERPQRTWFITLNADGTASNQGLGEDYGVSLNIETTF